MCHVPSIFQALLDEEATRQTEDLPPWDLDSMTTDNKMVLNPISEKCYEENRVWVFTGTGGWLLAEEPDLG